jgi:hypothetical protein
LNAAIDDLETGSDIFGRLQYIGGGHARPVEIMLQDERNFAFCLGLDE